MNDFNNNEDKEFIHACANGKIAAQEKLFKKYYSMMLGICLRYCSNKSEAKDLLQDGFIKVFNSIGSFKFEGPFVAWMKKIFINTAIDHYRKNQTLPQTVDIDEQFNIKDENDIFSNIDINEIMKYMNGMPPGYRTVFNLFAIEGYSHKEIAEKLNITEGTSKSQFAKARRYLQSVIKNNFA